MKLERLAYKEDYYKTSFDISTTNDGLAQRMYDSMLAKGWVSFWHMIDDENCLSFIVQTSEANDFKDDYRGSKKEQKDHDN